MRARPDKELGMEYVRLWRRDFGRPSAGRYGKRADFKNAALLAYAFLMLTWDADADEVRSYLPKTLQPDFDRYILPKAEQVRQGYANSVDGKSKANGVRKHGASTVQERCKNGASTVQAQCKHSASTDEDTQLPAETPDLGTTLFKAKSNAYAEPINQGSSIEAESQAHDALRSSTAEAAEAQARGREEKKSVTWRIHGTTKGAS